MAKDISASVASTAETPADAKPPVNTISGLSPLAQHSISGVGGAGIGALLASLLPQRAGEMESAAGYKKRRFNRQLLGALAGGGLGALASVLAARSAQGKQAGAIPTEQSIKAAECATRQAFLGVLSGGGLRIAVEHLQKQQLSAIP